MGSGSHSPSFFCPVLELGILLVSHRRSDVFLMGETDQRCQQLPGVYSTEAEKAESSLKRGSWGSQPQVPI